MDNQKTKFIIFGQGRSGSNLLVDLLNSHPDIYCDRELLNKRSISLNNIVHRLLISGFPYHYIKQHINNHPDKFYGFKLMYHQLRGREKLIPRLFNGNWKIIHIQRNDILMQTFSGIIAQKANKYIRTEKDAVDKNIYYIEPEKVLNGLKIRTKALAYEKMILKGTDYIDIVYEEDLANSNKWPESMERVFKYLGVQPVEVSANTFKTDNRTNEERISNYHEIMEYLKNTQFGNLVI
ncbi:MAG: hypothetical protein U9R19_17655 [Bacteroidota bacterium]|nr:hypothetical protein [Bacteroidota bacterium]